MIPHSARAYMITACIAVLIFYAQKLQHLLGGDPELQYVELFAQQNHFQHQHVPHVGLSTQQLGLQSGYRVRMRSMHEMQDASTMSNIAGRQDGGTSIMEKEVHLPINI